MSCSQKNGLSKKDKPLLNPVNTVSLYAYTLTMVFKLATCAEKKWKKLKGSELIEKVIKGVIFKDGVEVLADEKVA